MSRPTPPSAVVVGASLLVFQRAIDAGWPARRAWERVLLDDRERRGMREPVSLPDLDRAEQAARAEHRTDARVAAVLTADREVVR